MLNNDHEIEDTKIVGDSCPHLHEILILFTKSYLLKRSQTMIVINRTIMLFRINKDKVINELQILVT